VSNKEFMSYTNFKPEVREEMDNWTIVNSELKTDEYGGITRRSPWTAFENNSVGEWNQEDEDFVKNARKEFKLTP